jgi:hypothetical protein
MAERVIPESLGPGADAPDGSVTYGVESPAGRVVITPPVSAAERDRNMAASRERARCPRCLDVPDAVVLAVATALREAVRTGRSPQ